MDEQQLQLYLEAQRRHLQLMLLIVGALPDSDKRANLRAGGVHLLGAIEDVLGVERTIKPRTERRNGRLTKVLQ